MRPFRPVFALSALALLTLAACQPVAEPESAADVRVRVGPITSAEELEGIYRVADIEGIDMASLDRGLSVSITPDTIRVLDNCVSTAWTYRFEGERLVTTSIPGPTCRRALLREEAAAIRAFSGADRVSRTPANGVLFEGSGGSVTLFSQ